MHTNLKNVNDHMLSEFIPLSFLLAISVIYAVFDVFNNRNIPNLFVYVCLAAGLIITLTYPYPIAINSILIAFVILSLGYILYRSGILGAGDVMEFATISLILPLQGSVILHVPQLGLPFILSVFVGTGYAASIGIPIYYVLISGKKAAGLKARAVQAHRKATGVALFAAYLVFAAIIYTYSSLTLLGAVLILLIAVSSSSMIIMEDKIYAGMVSLISTSQLQEEDMIATNMLSNSERAYFEKKYPKFGRLATRSLIKSMRYEKKKIPVYKNAAPLSLFILIGVIVSLLLGNLILLVI